MNFAPPKVTSMNLNSSIYAPARFVWAFGSSGFRDGLGAKVGGFCTSIAFLHSATKIPGKAHCWASQAVARAADVAVGRPVHRLATVATRLLERQGVACRLTLAQFASYL